MYTSASMRARALEEVSYYFANKFWYIRYVSNEDPPVLDLDQLHLALCSYADKITPKYCAATIQEGGRIDMLVVFHDAITCHATQLPDFDYDGYIYHPNEVYHVKDFYAVQHWFDQDSTYYHHEQPWTKDIDEADIDEIIDKYY